jgi:S-adenosylmethionine decarboxylase
MENELWGLSASIDLYKCDGSIIRDGEKIKEFVKELCSKLGLKRFGETVVVNFGGNEKVEGFSMTQLIDTSLISGHFANKTNNAYIDVFSCKLFDPKEAAEFSKEFFKAEDYNLNVIERR